jgi:hypothetical protein
VNIRRLTTNDDACPTVEVSRRIQAPAAEVFQILANPEMHLPLDGSAMLRGAAGKQEIGGIGDIFVMNMHFHALGDYQMNNHIVEFELNKRIGWEPAAGVGHPQIGARVGHRWSFLLTPDGPDATVVTEIYDCSRAPADFRQQMDNGSMWIKSMEETLKRLEQMIGSPESLSRG